MASSTPAKSGQNESATAVNTTAGALNGTESVGATTPADSITIEQTLKNVRRDIYQKILQKKPRIVIWNHHEAIILQEFVKREN